VQETPFLQLPVAVFLTQGQGWRYQVDLGFLQLQSKLMSGSQVDKALMVCEDIVLSLFLI
jgi:hypothetical protein